MIKLYENKYAKLKNYELESVFDLSKKEKEFLSKNIDTKTKHTLKLQELYLKINAYDFTLLEEEALAYLNHHKYLLEKEHISKFYELLAYAANNIDDEIEQKYLNLSLETYPTMYCLKHSVYLALKAGNIHMAGRLMLIAIEADIELDSQLSYYNLVVEHYFEEDILEYYILMAEFHEKFISVDNITIEFSFNKVVADYYIQKHIKFSDEKVVLQAKKTINELLLKAISSMKNEDELRSEVLRVRAALERIDNDPDVDIFSLITFNLLPAPKGVPSSSPFTKIK